LKVRHLVNCFDPTAELLPDLIGNEEEKEDWLAGQSRTVTKGEDVASELEQTSKAAGREESQETLNLETEHL
jgi:hypothetical protein